VTGQRQTAPSGKPHITPKTARPVAKLITPPPYVPELDAYGLKLNENGQVVPAVECPDLPMAKIMADPKAIVDARLWEGKFNKGGRLLEHQVTERLSKTEMAGRYTRLREARKLSESDWFSLGGPDSYGTYGQSALDQNYVPLIPGPATRQQYWADYWASSAKAFEASTHSGIAKRACRAMVQFPLGRGVRWKISDPAALKTWEAFWDGNKMRRRLRSIFFDLSVFGEQFLRYFPAPTGDPRGLIVRQLDPATIYEIVTDQEDLETVYFYHQQFQTRIELYSPPAGGRTPQGRTQSGVTRYVIRQIPAAEIDHWKINDVSGEARGRSDLFPALGDLKRLRDLMTSKVIQSDLGNRVLAIVQAKGTAADIQRVINQIFPNGQPPAPGSIVGLNDSTTLEPFEYSGAKEVRSDFTYDELVDGISAGTGIARAYLGISPANGGGTTQATASSTTEPSIQTFEERQGIGDELLHEMFDRVMAAAGINGEIDCEFLFPQIASEDSAGKINMAEQAEAAGYIGRRTAASIAAAELDLTDYDFENEMKAIAEEFDAADETDGTDDMGNNTPARGGGKIRRYAMRSVQRQIPKIDVTKAQKGDDDPLGMLVGPDGVIAGGAPGQNAGQGGGGPEPATPPATAPKVGSPQPGGSRNPASKAGRQAIATTTREAAGAPTPSQLRRTPTDPDFQGHAEQLAQATAANLHDLLLDLDGDNE
jgi:hypothetical protein